MALTETMAQYNVHRPDLIAASFEGLPDTLAEAGGDKEEDHTIHSGQFMLSRVHDDDETEGEEAAVQETTVAPATSETPSRSRHGSQGSIAIDSSLTRLFECMSLAYCQKLTSPKWNPFKGMRLSRKDRIRLNNLIWREWHMQFRMYKSPVVCQFATPINEDTHKKPEACVMEGKYWKRHLTILSNEYLRWRSYYKTHPKALETSESADDEALLAKMADAIENTQYFSKDDVITEDDIMEFTDTIFSLNAPFLFPDPKEFGS